MTSSADFFPTVAEGDGVGVAGKSGVTFYADDLVDLYGPEAAANNGLADKHGQVLNRIPLGNAAGRLIGLGVAQTATLKVGSNVLQPVVQRTVTGVTGAGDVGKEVFSSDENTYTITVPASFVTPVGVIVRWLTGTTCLVWMYGFECLRAKEFAAHGLVRLNLGVIDGASIANGNMLIDEPLQFHGQIESFYARCQKVPTGAGAAATLKLQIKPSGGAYADVGAPTTIALALANTLGQVIPSAAIPLVLSGAGMNVFHDGDKLQVVASGVTAFTAGLYTLEAVCRTRIGS
jgi:hypothetical protein